MKQQRFSDSVVRMHTDVLQLLESDKTFAEIEPKLYAYRAAARAARDGPSDVALMKMIDYFLL